MTLRFYADTHIAKQVAIQLQEQGIDIIRCQDVGMEDAKDPEHLEYAVRNERALLTKDDDFLRLHSDWQALKKNHFGIFYCPYRDKASIGLIVGACAEYHELILNEAGTLEGDINNQVIFIT